MDLSQALNTALSGLNVTQADLAVTAANVANANTPGYVLKQSVQVETAGDGGISVDTAGINRELNTQVQSQLWTESAGGSFADAQAQFYQQLQSIYGTPGSSNAFDSAFNTFTSALQTLSTSPSSSSAQTGAVSAAQGLAQNLNSMATSIQGLRTQAEQGIASDVQQANAALQQIAQPFAFEQFGYQVRNPTGRPCIVNGDHVGMIQRRDRAGLLLESPHALAILRERLGQNLEGHVAPEPCITGAVDFAHPAGADRGDDLIRSQTRARGERHDR